MEKKLKNYLNQYDFRQNSLNNYYLQSFHYKNKFRFHYKFYGNIDDIQIWNTALSQSTIQQYMNCPPAGNEEGLAGYWNFELGIGGTVLDQSGNGNDGTINGATFDTNVPTQSCQLTT